VRILHLLSYVDRESSYGGPLSVAAAQCENLAQRGHDVTLLAGWDGAAQLHIPGVRVKLRRAFRNRRLGFGTVTSPSLIWAANRWARNYDVVHVHLGRDFAVLPAALAASRLAPTILQCHGMVGRSDGPIKRILDKSITSHVFARASRILTLTATEESDLSTFPGTQDRLQRLANFSPRASANASYRANVRPEVLFLARLHERKRPLAFIHMAAELLSRGIEARFTLIGPDEGQRALVETEILRRGLSSHVSVHNAIPTGRVQQRLAEAHVYVLPSVREPFPVTVLEALAVGVPSVITNDTGVSQTLRDAGAAVVVSPEPKAIADGVALLLSSKSDWLDISSAAKLASTELFSSDSVVRELETIYARSVK
jgi:glycosyltransferase involved in cell wall biosynthesis